VPFLRDFAVQARFLLSVPLLLFAETIVGSHWARAAGHFVSSGLVGDEDIAQFVLFCVPLFQFLVLRWLWWQFLWGQFLWRVSKLHLQLIPTHPDEAAGLAFVGEAQRSFRIVLFAFSIVVSGVLANAVVYDHVPLRDLTVPIVIYLIAAGAIVLTPLAVFLPILHRTRRLGLNQYGTLGTAYTSSFHKKWIAPEHPPAEPLLGTSDIQSLADLGNSFGIIKKMNSIPMGSRTLMQMAWACLIPMAPLLLTVASLEELLKMLAKLVF
jgi:hypothetical protein